MDPEEYYTSRRTEKAQRAAFVVEEVLKTPADQVTDAAREAFLAVDPSLLPERLKKEYARKKRKLLSGETEAEAGAAQYAGLDEDVPVPASSARCPSRLPRAYSGWDELSERENRWLIKQTGCSVEQLEEKFVYCVAWEKANRDGGVQRRFRWFLHPNDPIDGAIARYRTNGPDTTLAGTAFFGTADSSFCK